jgi:hypothetical protein
MLGWDPIMWGMGLYNAGVSYMKHPKDYHLSFDQIVKNAGFNFEQHKVTTEDGYILTMFRIRSP